MEDHGLFLLIASIAALGAGPLLYHVARHRRAVVIGVHALVVISILALVVLHILPECVEMAGWGALLAAAAGLLGPILAERRVKSAFARAPKLALGLGLVALTLHEFTDGVALVDGHHHGHEHSEESVHALGLAVVLHRLPVGAALFWMLRPHGARAVLLAFFAVIVASCLGFAFGEHALELLSPVALAFFQAFVGGVLLHVLLHSHTDGGHAHAAHA